VEAATESPQHDSFHISIAWSLQAQGTQSIENGDWEELRIREERKEKFREMRVEFEEVKVRIGQDVSAVPLRRRRGLVPGGEIDDDKSGRTTAV
jgi:hypothetical protein